MTTDRPALRILVVATKLPYPPVDGGRLLLWNTATALAERGHELTLVAPHHEVPLRDELPPFRLVHTVPIEETSLLRASATALATGRPISIIRHSNPFMHHAVEQLLRNWEFDLVHVEQIHALPHIPRERITIPVVMRCQNAESELWSMLAAVRPRLRWLAGWQARQMQAFEARSVRSANLALALTRHDQIVLSRLSGLSEDSLPVVPAPFPSRLEPRGSELSGSPPVLLLDSQWVPNRDGTDWFLDQIWPDIRRRLPARWYTCSATGPARHRRRASPSTPHHRTAVTCSPRTVSWPSPCASPPACA